MTGNYKDSGSLYCTLLTNILYKSNTNSNSDIYRVSIVLLID